MTAQISDSVLYLGEEYSLTGVKGEGLFDPKQFGLELVRMHTACYRGFIAAYTVTDGRLQMERLHINPAAEEVDIAALPTIYGGRPAGGECGFFYHDAPDAVPFTGGMLIGRDFLAELYVHMGYHPAWKFREVHELVFTEGRLTEQRDVSAAMEKYRQERETTELKPNVLQTHPDIYKDWIRSTFSLDYFNVPGEDLG